MKESKKLFQNKRHVTKGIHEEMGSDLQSYLWSLVDWAAKAESVNLLQVFDLNIIMDDKCYLLQEIIHMQADPEFKIKYTVRIAQPLADRRVFVIDDSLHTIMMFAEEY